MKLNAIVRPLAVAAALLASGQSMAAVGYNVVEDSLHRLEIDFSWDGVLDDWVSNSSAASGMLVLIWMQACCSASRARCHSRVAGTGNTSSHLTRVKPRRAKLHRTRSICAPCLHPADY